MQRTSPTAFPRPVPAATGEPLSTTLLSKGRRVRRPGSIALTRALGTLVGRDASFVQFLSVRWRWGCGAGHDDVLILRGIRGLLCLKRHAKRSTPDSIHARGRFTPSTLLLQPGVPRVGVGASPPAVRGPAPPLDPGGRLLSRTTVCTRAKIKDRDARARAPGTCGSQRPRLWPSLRADFPPRCLLYTFCGPEGDCLQVLTSESRGLRSSVVALRRAGAGQNVQGQRACAR